MGAFCGFGGETSFGRWGGEFVLSLPILLSSSSHSCFAALKYPWMQNQMKNIVVSLDGHDYEGGPPYCPFLMITVRWEHEWWSVSLLWRHSNGFRLFLFLPMHEQDV